MSHIPDRAGRSAQSEERQRPASGSGPATGLSHLGEVMGQVARALQQEHGDVEATLHAITAAAVTSVPGTDACGITLVIGRRTVESRAPTGALPRRIDRLQEELGEGPCLDAVWEQQTVRIDDVDREERWTRFPRAAAEAGLGSLLSFQLFVTGDNMGALNLYAGEPHAFGEESESVGLVFASHASIALAGAREEANLRAAVASRDLIGQAKGILMERFKVPADQAFTMLARASSHTNRRVVDIAEELCRTGALPGPRPQVQR
ncbi:GAF and ANTAR domain-containing protein [Geodermatophilus sp. SYSU D00815]